uniref:Uncharacterized protein n=1 Tax=Aegilops tauschii subsp. strangulata TaxID=200361 RepID=A0A453NXL3_AEGTS
MLVPNFLWSVLNIARFNLVKFGPKLNDFCQASLGITEMEGTKAICPSQYQPSHCSRFIICIDDIDHAKGQETLYTLVMFQMGCV